MTQIEFTPLNNLERLLVEAATNPAARPAFYQSLLETDLVLLATVEPEAVQNGVTMKETPIQVITWMKETEPVVPIFTAVERLQEAIKDTGVEFPYIVMNGSMLFGALAQGTMSAVLNPRCVIGKEFILQEMRDLADGKIFQQFEAVPEQPRQVSLGQPATYPQQMVDALKDVFRDHDVIDAAYLAQIFDPASGNAGQILVGIQANGNIEEAVGDAGIAIDSTLPNGQGIEFVLMDGGEIDAYLIQQTTPFYIKGEAADEEEDFDDMGLEGILPPQPFRPEPAPERPAPPSEQRSAKPAPAKSAPEKPWWKIW